MALAYVDQLERGDALPAALRSSLRGALDRAGAALGGGESDPGLARELAALAKQAAGSGYTRRNALGETLEGIARRLR